MGNCISSGQETEDMGISSSQINNNSKKVNKFHDGNQATGPSNNYNNARNAKVLKRPKKIHKGLIGLPGNFQHTGHIGIAEMRSGKVDPEKIRSAMSEIAGAINLEITDSANSSSVPVTPTSETRLVTSEGLDSSSVSSSQTSQRKSSLQSDTTPNSQQLQISSPQSSSQLSPISSDPMAEIVAALKMPADGNFDLFDNKDSTTTVA